MAFLDNAGVDRLWRHIVGRLGEKVDVVAGKGQSTNDYTDDEKNKLAGVEAEANKTIVDDDLSETSTNPLQNKVLTTSLIELAAYLQKAAYQNPDENGTIYLYDFNINPISQMLPVVTAADAGKFLRVQADGTWAAVAVPNAEEAGF